MTIIGEDVSPSSISFRGRDVAALLKRSVDPGMSVLPSLFAKKATTVDGGYRWEVLHNACCDQGAFRAALLTTFSTFLREKRVEAEATTPA